IRCQEYSQQGHEDFSCDTKGCSKAKRKPRRALDPSLLVALRAYCYRSSTGPISNEGYQHVLLVV
ncbi:hypothetical protein BGX23_004122, partial [Mortierella sp. AD031]